MEFLWARERAHIMGGGVGTELKPLHLSFTQATTTRIRLGPASL